MKRTSIAIVIFAIGVASAFHQQENNRKWQLYKTKYEKNYSSLAEHQFRKEVFLSSLETISDHNKRFSDGLESFRMGLNHFSDMVSRVSDINCYLISYMEKELRLYKKEL